MATTLAQLITLTVSNRKFNVTEYITHKVTVINNFFRENGLDSCVIGISGGVDSAVVLGLMVEASKELDSPLKRIQCLVMPIHGNGTTDNDQAQRFAEKQIQQYWGRQNKHDAYISCLTADLTDAYKAYINIQEQDCGYEMGGWVNGQLASIVRTPFMYYQAAVLQKLGLKSIVVGTTNRDEGSYIGFFGKASDGMVDLQPIADIHKSEVYECAKALGVIDEIFFEKPKGDVHDGRTDEQMIGAPYWFLELYLRLIEGGNLFLLNNLSDDEKIKAQSYIDNIEKLHKTNLHKYKVGSPAHFIDVMPRKIPGGWQ